MDTPPAQPVQPVTQTPPPQVQTPQQEHMVDPSPSTKKWLTIAALIFTYPLGLILMWGWMKQWATWLKVLLTLPILGIPSLLFAISLLAVNPGRQFQYTNNTKRTSDVNVVVNALRQYAVAHNGEFPEGLDQTSKPLDSRTFRTLCTELLPTYVAALPRDPLVKEGLPIQPEDCAGDWHTGYTVRLSPSGKSVISSAPKAELDAVIEAVSR